MVNRTLVFLLALLLLISCEDKSGQDTPEDKVIYSGTVIDAETLQPVKDALVSFQLVLACDGRVVSFNDPVKSDANGRFKLVISKDDWVKTRKNGCIGFKASKEGYAGSDLFVDTDDGQFGHDTPVLLYHYGILNLQVKNSLPNEIDKVYVYVYSGYNFLSPDATPVICEGGDFDSVLIFNKLKATKTVKVTMSTTPFKTLDPTIVAWHWDVMINPGGQNFKLIEF